MKYWLVFSSLIVAALAPPLTLQPHSGLDRYDIQLRVASGENGQFMHYRNFAAYEWRNGLPEEAGGRTRKIIGEFANNVHLIVWFYDGSFHSSNGSRWGAPLRWAYLRQAEEIWNGTTWVMPDGTPMPLVDTVTYRADDLQGAVDFLMDRFTVPVIQDAMDKSKSFFPRAGVPEG